MRELGFNSSDISIELFKKICAEANFESDKELTAIDCGANIGEFSDLILGSVTNVKIYLIEPQEYLCQILKRKYIDMRNIKILQTGISLENGRANLNLTENGDRKATLGNHRKNTRSEEIQVMTLKSICKTQKIKKIDILKLDLEGLDSIILEDFFIANRFAKPKVVVIEVSYLSHFRGITAKSTFSMLKEQGYRSIYRVSPRLGLIKVEAKYLSEYEGHTTNWVAIY
jgi:FkbM family methyltransferase